MHPILFKIGPFTIHTYGVLVALGFLIGTSFAIKHAKEYNITKDTIVDIAFYIILSALIGSRLFFILIKLDYYIKNPLSIFKIWEGGLVFYGGVLLAIPVVILYAKKHFLSILKIADIFSPSIAIGHAIGRLGCFSAGCCYGKPSSTLPWAITFTDPHSIAPIGIPLHPTQLYESLGEFTNFIILLILRKKKSFDGQLFLIYLIFYSILRFTIEFFRGDPDRGLILTTFSIPQFISLLTFFSSIIIYIKLKKTRSINS
jgi:phosphatidylglycerol:prolipoprotein diacylglycerol transferase